MYICKILGNGKLNKMIFKSDFYFFTGVTRHIY